MQAITHAATVTITSTTSVQNSKLRWFLNMNLIHVPC